jgi:hypothetical protein
VVDEVVDVSAIADPTPNAPSMTTVVATASSLPIFFIIQHPFPNFLFPKALTGYHRFLKVDLKAA